jgi:hypothetical protein
MFMGRIENLDFNLANAVIINKVIKADFFMLVQNGRDGLGAYACIGREF